MSEHVAGAEKTNRPENTKFKQQKLDAWQPILTPAWVIGTFFFVGVVFVPVGAYLWKLSNDLFESTVTYDSFDSARLSAQVNDQKCTISYQNQGYTEVVAGNRSVSSCILEFEFSQDISEGDPVYLYYELSNFYQNHRRYVKSLSETQIQNEVFINGVTNVKDTDLETACDPVNKSYSTNYGNTLPNTANRIYYPCGLIALSVFNDGISLNSFTAANGTTYSYVFGTPTSSNAPPLVLDTSSIAWSTDLSNKYRNPTNDSCSNNLSNPGGNLCPIRYYQYQYLWQTYNQFTCYNTLDGTSTGIPNTASPAACVTFTQFVEQEIQNYNSWNPSAPYDLSSLPQNAVFQGACAKCQDENAAFVSLGGIQMPPPSEWSNSQSSNGLRTPAFAVWMRTAGLPTFRKQLAKIIAPPGGFKQGSKISFQVVPNFLVSTIRATKSLVLMTSSDLGGKNEILGIAYLSVGAICLFLALVFAVKLKISPRKLGDPQYLQWKKK